MALPFLTAGPGGGGEATEFPRHSQRFSFFRRGCGPEGSPLARALSRPRPFWRGGKDSTTLPRQLIEQHESALQQWQ